jgi:hypothetical protein
LGVGPFVSRVAAGADNVNAFALQAGLQAGGAILGRAIGLGIEAALASRAATPAVRVVINWAYRLQDIRPGHLPPPGTQAEIQAAVETAIQGGRYTTDANGVINGMTDINGIEVGFTGNQIGDVIRIRTVFKNPMSSDPGSYARIPPRPPTSQEAAWIRDIVLCNPDWADVDLENLHIVAECTCGCRSVVLEEPAQPQNPRFIGHQGLVGEISLCIELDGRKEVMSVLLHFAEGSLSLLEVIWHNDEPIPATWTEISRHIDAGR